MFQRARWLPGAHLQTLGGRVLRSRGGLRLRRERIDTPDGDFVDLDWLDTPERDVRRPLCVVLHGLEGSARSGYALETYRRLAERDVAAVGFNFRSCSGVLNRQPRLYHSGDTGDIAYVLELLRDRAPDRPLGAVGYSLGGNALLRYLGACGGGRTGRRAMIDAAAVVSVPYDLAAGAAHMERGFARLYVARLLRSLKRKLRAKADLIGDRVDLPRALAATTFRTFDDAATAPLHGFAGADDYYRRASSGPLIGRIRVPVRLIHALDDPFLPAHAVPTAAIGANPSLDGRIVAQGGHVGFVEGTPWAPRFWAERAAAAFVADRLHMRRSG